ncbi:MAG: leucyl aminopeptidase, partial [Acidobacteriaceae bacterium]|nr:leucyl aminopeptidase [Acidobacteriaceae bacterium]
MQIRVETIAIQDVTADALAVICFEADEKKTEEKKTGEGPPGTGEAPADAPITAQNGWLAELRSSGEFTGKPYEIAILHRPQGTGAKRLVVLGGGKRDKFSAVEARRAAGALVRALKGKGARTIALLLTDFANRDYVSATVEGAILGAWEADKYKSDPKKNEKHVDTFTIVLPDGDAANLQEAAERGRIIADGQNLARDLVNEPANKLTPAALSDAAQQMAGRSGLEYEVLDQAAMAQLGMGALLGVAQGSTNPPFLIVLKYRPGGEMNGKDHLALVGKGVTFDTGGISIKPSDGMEKMKYDMAGAAAVIGAMQAIAQLKPAIPVTAYVPTVENMVNGNAQRPGDIVTSLAGKTIEVLNTDAEGRLILADAITYAVRHGATHLVDAATLTGAIAIALGHYNIGAFTNNQEFVERVLGAAKAAGEKMWQ